MSRRGACLIAGCGDVGGRLAASLAARGETVYALRRSSAPLPQGVTAVHADLTDRASLRGLPGDITRLVFLPAPDARTEAAYRGLYLDGFAHLLEVLDPARLERVVYVSSSAVYGEHGGAWVDEDSPCRPLAFNGTVLLAAERHLATLPVRGVAMRFSGLYGPRRTQLLAQVASGRAVAHAGWTNRLHVEDAARALEHVLDLADPQACYVVSDDEPAPMADVVAWLAARLGVSMPAADSGRAAVGDKRLANHRLRASGFRLRFTDYQAGYSALLDDRRMSGSGAGWSFPL